MNSKHSPQTKDQSSIVASFVHGYSELDIVLPETERPALWVSNEQKSKIYSYQFPRNPQDFEQLGSLLVGEKPFSGSENYKKLPRFGFTGLADTETHIFAGNWSSIYKIRKETYELEALISNHLMNDLHGIYVDQNIIISVLTSKDLIVISDHAGKIIEHFAVANDLTVYQDSNVDKYDWRFISKQFRGSCGLWHFNYIQKFGSELWLTSRNINSFVVIDLKTKKAWLRLINPTTPLLIHDGLKVNDKYYFTSIDGKILIAEEHHTAGIKSANWEDPGNLDLYNRDLVTQLIRINETSLKREPNWCRGLDCKDGIIYVTIDGRYDSDLSFGLLAIREENQEIVFNRRLRWSEVGEEKDIRYVTGFDVIAL